MEELLVGLLIVIALPWMLFHYLTKWKTTPRLTDSDEAMLEELYQLARRLDQRMETVERLVAADDPRFEASIDRHRDDRLRLVADQEADRARLDELDRKLHERNTR
ncbi:envelope stress response membrane protein PspB [Croceicoccus sp. F390]|uniref:Envelope stress response membrane protein PspB n=1 Tax=Croceicoccus esteveae TaxID=3075597 RepID=A0ABU2ZI50_9SPHN|nr:envelope stress response membrane protein PspB [Croceicoccus sp. F390]MDT0576075.1 envelope stress response membrane protein PspB [Croceicoccus sp. F390]